MMTKVLCSLSLALLAAPLVARADSNPDFDEDAMPLLRQQPGLLNYVRSHFEVKETGKAKYPGDDDHRPGPPYIFRARERGAGGPYNIKLLIQPGPPGRILCVVPPSGNGPTPAPQPQPPEVAQQQEPQPQPFQPAQQQSPYQSPSLSQGDIKPLPPEQQTQTPAPAPQPAPPSGPIADTPSGPILPNSSTGTTNNPQQNLAPPPDPAPAGQ